MDNPFVAVPMRLDESDIPRHMSGRVAFVVDSDAQPDAVAALAAIPGVSIPPTPSDLFGRGLQALFRNYLAGREVREGIAALCDDSTFLAAVRRLADTVYGAALTRSKADRIVDASPTNLRVIEVIRAVYPEAPIIRGESDLDALRSSWARPVSPRPVASAAPGAASGVAPVFVVGVPRSGTTWLENMLRAHPALDGPGRETSIFVSLRALRDNLARPPSEGLAGWIEPAAVVGAMRAFVETLLAHYLAQKGSEATRFLEKTPLHAEHAALIAEVFPDAAIISIHRDGRDVVRSLLEMDAATSSVVVAASKWAEISRRFSDALPSLPKARDERYEELLADPVASVTGILAWLGLEVDAAVADALRTRAAERVAQFNTTGEVGPGKWRSLAPHDRREVYRHAGDRLVELGYMTADELRRERVRPLYRAGDAARRLTRRA